MPELPEVETTRRGIAPHLIGHVVTALRVRERRLRWPVPETLDAALPGQRIDDVERRAKYLLLRTGRGTVLLHLGMSGSLRLIDAATAPGKHDHVDFELDNGRLLRLTDPRRFGAVLWTIEPPQRHPLLAALGPEPLSAAFDGDHLSTQARGRRSAVKTFLMDGRIVVGVGNIYANEALFLAGIDPRRAAGRVARERYQHLAAAVKSVLAAAIEAGGTTLRDFVGGDGRPGYFAQALRVYGRGGLPCPTCAVPLREQRIGQRSSVYCAHCQK